MNLVKLNRQIFICLFDSTKYPFGKEADCKIIFYLHGVSKSLTVLKPRIINRGPAAIGQYLLEKWTIQSDSDEIQGNFVQVRLLTPLARGLELNKDGKEVERDLMAADLSTFNLPSPCSEVSTDWRKSVLITNGS